MKLSSGSKRGPTQRTTSGQQSGQQPCHRCGRTEHTGQNCKFKESKCHKCHNRGHIAAVCRSSKKRSSKKVVKRVIEDDLDEDESDIRSVSVNANSQGRSSKPITVTVEMSGKDVVMELDTGAAVTIMSLSTFKKLFPRKQLRHTQLVLKTYTGQPMEVVGEVTMNVTYQNQAVKSLDLVVVKEKGPTLLGRDWLKHIQLDWKTISRETSVAAILDKYGEVFTPELGTMRQFEATLPLKENAQPVFKKIYRFPIHNGVM